MMKFFRQKPSDQDVSIDPGAEQGFIDPRSAKYPAEAGEYPRLSNIRLIFEGTSDSFSLAFGDWEDRDAGLQKQQMLLIRWNGNGNDLTSPKDRGFPIHSLKHPAWFPVPSIFAEPILKKLGECAAPTSDIETLAKEHGFTVLEHIN